jgi:hypothetical protein
MLISKTLLLMASSLALATQTLAQEQATPHDPDGMSLGGHGRQKVPQGILDAQRRWIELEAVPPHHGVHGREAPARSTPQRFAVPATPKAAASRAAPQGRGRDRAPANSSAKSAVPAGKRKVVVYEEVILVPSGSPQTDRTARRRAWLKDFWKNQERQSGGGGSEGGGSGGGGGGHGY